jgi:hypothetical protein
MKRFLGKIGRFFWSWGFLKFVLAVIALVILFYVEEDWRGAHAWAATKAKWEAKGESFDFAKFIPSPVPDDQNLAALPLFKLEPKKYDTGVTEMLQVTLQRAMRDDLTQLDFPRAGSWQKGELTDMAQFKKTLASDYVLAFKDKTPPDDALAQFNAIYPFFSEFMGAAAARPLFRLNLDYTISPPAARPLGPITAPIKLSKILTLHAILALDAHRSDLALPDIKTNYEVLAGVKRDPTLVGGLVAIGMNAINGAVLYNGLAQHQWSDAQLVAIDETLKPINFLDDFQFAMRSEVVQSNANLEFFERASMSHMQKTFGRGPVAESGLEDIFRLPWPSGWWDGNKALHSDILFQSMTAADPQARMVFPKEADALHLQIEKARASWRAFAPWSFLAYIAAGPVINSLQKYAQAQVWVDETRIACALERYRLAHGVYPDSLDALAPTYIDAVPHDIMNGQPYHYSLRADGTFQLYSVGWNQTDDGGKVAFKQDSPNQIDYEQGDWVWPTPKAAAAK